MYKFHFPVFVKTYRFLILVLIFTWKEGTNSRFCIMLEMHNESLVVSINHVI